MSGQQFLPSCRTGNLNPPCLTSRRSQPPLARSVPLSRFTSRVGGGSAFYVRHHHTLMKPRHIFGIAVRVVGLIIALVGTYFLVCGLVLIVDSGYSDKPAPVSHFFIFGVL